MDEALSPPSAAQRDILNPLDSAQPVMTTLCLIHRLVLCSYNGGFYPAGFAMTVYLVSSAAWRSSTA